MIHHINIYKLIHFNNSMIHNNTIIRNTEVKKMGNFKAKFGSFSICEHCNESFNNHDVDEAQYRTCRKQVNKK